MILEKKDFRPWIETFNRQDDEHTSTTIPNADSWQWLADNIPFFDCPDREILGAYYFRWWLYRKHLRQTRDGWVVSEFLPEVSWSKKHNTIPCAAGFHCYEGRWLRDPSPMRDYGNFWLFKGGEPHYMTFWLADSLLAINQVHPDTDLLSEWLPALIDNYQWWQQNHGDPCGLFWVLDTPSVEVGISGDGMEYSAGGSGCRPTLNSYMYADAKAIADIAGVSGKEELSEKYRAEAAAIKAKFQTLLWDPEAQFFKTLTTEKGQEAHWQVGGYAHKRAMLPTHTPGSLADAREQVGFVPWCFNLPDPGYETAWEQLFDPMGFAGTYGPTTCERRHPVFCQDYGHDCLWNGPSWPFATTQTLKAMANLLQNYDQNVVSASDYQRQLHIYAHSHHLIRDSGEMVWFLDENLDPDTGEWLARKKLMERAGHDTKRGKDYNHSGFCDLVITGAVGLTPQVDDFLELAPLATSFWDYFSLDNVCYHGHDLGIVWDRTGEHYGAGKGLSVYLDGAEVSRVEGGPGSRISVRVPMT